MEAHNPIMQGQVEHLPERFLFVPNNLVPTLPASMAGACVQVLALVPENVRAFNIRMLTYVYVVHIQPHTISQLLQKLLGLVVTLGILFQQSLSSWL